MRLKDWEVGTVRRVDEMSGRERARGEGRKEGRIG